MISMVSFSEFRKGSASHPLMQFNLLVGPSGSGKSSVLSAINIALLGCDPRVGKRLQDTFKFCHSEAMTVTLHMSSEDAASEKVTEQITRSIRRKGASFTQDVLVNDRSVPAAEATDIAGRMVGLPITLNLPEFLELSADRKAAFLFSLYQASMSHQDITEAIVHEVIGETAWRLLDADKLSGLRALPPEERHAIEGLLVSIRGVTGIDAVISKVKELLNFARGDLKRFEQTLSGLVAQRNQYGEAAGTVDDYRVQITEQQNQLAEVSRQLGEAKQILKQRAETQFRIDSLRAALQKHEAIASRKQPDSAGMQALELEMETLEAELSVISSASKDRTQEIQRLTLTLPPDQPMSVECPNCQTRFLSTPDQISRDRIQKQIDELKGQDLAAWKRLDATKSESAKLVIRRRQMEAEQAVEQSAITSSKSTVEDIKLRLAEAEGELTALSQGGQTDTDLLSTQKMAIQTKLLQLEGEKELIVKRNTIETSIASANIAVAENRANVEMAQKAHAALTGLRNRNLAGFAAQIGPAVAEVLDGIGEMQINVSEKDCQILCRSLSGPWVDFDVLSGGETVIYSAALICGLTAIANKGGQKLLLLELGEMSAHIVEPFLRNLERICQKLEIQVLAASCHTQEIYAALSHAPAPQYSGNWNVIDLEPNVGLAADSAR